MTPEHRAVAQVVFEMDPHRSEAGDNPVSFLHLLSVDRADCPGQSQRRSDLYRHCPPLVYHPELRYHRCHVPRGGD